MFQKHSFITKWGFLLLELTNLSKSQTYFAKHYCNSQQRLWCPTKHWGICFMTKYYVTVWQFVLQYWWKVLQNLLRLIIYPLLLKLSHVKWRMIQRLVHWVSMKLYQNHYPLFTLTWESCIHTCKRKKVNNSCGSDQKFEGSNPLFGQVKNATIKSVYNAFDNLTTLGSFHQLWPKCKEIEDQFQFPFMLGFSNLDFGSVVFWLRTTYPDPCIKHCMPRQNNLAPN